MTDLERRALLGDQEAQKECTEKGIALPCPHCGAKDAEIIKYAFGRLRYECQSCHAATCLHGSAKMALVDWNTRPAPPIGRCSECKNWDEDYSYGLSRFGIYMCACHEWSDPENGMTRYTGENDYCGHFEPKEREENAVD